MVNSQTWTRWSLKYHIKQGSCKDQTRIEHSILCLTLTVAIMSLSFWDRSSPSLFSVRICILASFSSLFSAFSAFFHPFWPSTFSFTTAIKLIMRPSSLVFLPSLILPFFSSNIGLPSCFFFFFFFFLSRRHPFLPTCSLLHHDLADLALLI